MSSNQELKRMLEQHYKLQHLLLERIEEMTTALDRLNASVAAQTTAITANTAAVEAAVAAGIGTGTGDSQDALNAVADAIEKNTADIAANTAKLPPVAPAPAPAPGA
jgi:methyl-accepting chemotaxis protein